MATTAVDVWDDLVELITERATDYQTFQEYWEGEQNLPVESSEFRSRFGSMFSNFRDNLARPVIESAEGRVRIKGFGDGKNIGADAMRLWKQNRMTVESRWVHTEALVKGDAFVIVLPDEDGNAGIWPQISDSCAILYDPINPRKKTAAFKWWVIRKTPVGSVSAQDYIRVNLYFDNRIERYISSQQSNTLLPDFAKYEPYTDEGAWKSRHKVGEVPMFEFNANYDINTGRGRSDLADGLSFVDAINKTFLDMMVSSEFTAAPQRWATGVEIPLDPKTGEPVTQYQAGGHRLWTAPSEEARFGQFPSGELKSYKDAVELLVDHLSFDTRTPTYALMRQAEYPSGEALRSAEAPLRSRVQDHQDDFGVTWALVMKAALKLDGVPVSDDDIDSIMPEWLPVNAPFATREFLEELKIHGEVLGIPEEMLWKKAGYTVEEIEEMKQMRLDEAALGFDAEAQAQADAFAAGAAPPLGPGGINIDTTLPPTPGGSPPSPVGAPQ